MKRLLLTLILCLVLAPLLAGGSCATSGDTKVPLPTLPAVVDRVIEVPKPLPGYLTVELEPPKRTGGTVEAYKVSERAWEAFGELANCHRRIADKIARGEAPDPAICGASP